MARHRHYLWKQQATDESYGWPTVSESKETVTRYIGGFTKNDQAQVLSCLTDDIE